MRFRWLVFLPLAWSATFVLMAQALRATPIYEIFMRSEIELVKVAAMLGGFAAAFAFRQGEYLRRAWLFVGGSNAFFLIRDLTLAPLGFETLGETPLLVLRALLVALGNVSMVIGVFMLARTWKVAGLTLPGRPRGQLAVIFVTVLFAVALAGPGVWTFGGRLLGGDLTAAAGVASALGDMITLILIGPLLLTALALRGGLFAWPWALLTTSCLAWLFYDAFVALGPTLGLGPEATRIAYEGCRALGGTFGCAAGLAQRAIALGRTVQI